MPRIVPDRTNFAPRLRSTRAAGGFDTDNMGNAVVVRPDATGVALADLIRQRDEQAALWDGYWRYTGFRVNGASETNSPASPDVPSHIRYTVTSDPAVIAALDLQVPDTDRVRYADGAHGYILDRFGPDWTAYAPAVDFDIPASAPASERLGKVAQRFQILRRITELTNAIHVASAPASAPATATLRILHMEPNARAVVDGTDVTPRGNWATGAAPFTWDVPVTVPASGRIAVRLVPPSGSSRAPFDATVNVAAGSRADVDWTAPAASAPATATLRILHMEPNARAVVDGTDVTPRGNWATGAAPFTWDVPVTVPASGRIAVRLVPPSGSSRAPFDATVNVAAGSRADVDWTAPAASAPTLRIVGMPPHATAWIDGERTKDDLSRWSDAAQTAWIVPAVVGEHTVRVVPPTGGGNARTATVTVPATGEASVTFSAMTEERPAATTGTVMYHPAEHTGESTTAAVLRAAPAVTPIPLGMQSDGTWIATAPAGRYTLEVIVQPPMSTSSPGHDPTIPPAAQYAADVTITAGQTAHVARADLRATGQIVPRPDDAAPPVPNTTTGRVIVRSTVPNTAVMVQRVAGSQGELDTGRAFTEGPAGTFTADVPSGTYQIVAWTQPGGDGTGALFARQNVRTAPATVTTGGEVRYDYTGSSLVYAGGRLTAAGDSHDAIVADRFRQLADLNASSDFVLLHYDTLTR